MSLRTFRKYCINQYSKIIVGSVLWTLPFCSLANKFPGIISTLEETIELDRTRFNQKESQISKNVLLSSEVIKHNNLLLDEDFVSSILFHTDKRFLKLIESNQCTFLALLDAGLLQNASGRVSDVIVNANGKSALIPKRDYLEHQFKNSCGETKKISDQFHSFRLQAIFEQIKPANLKTENDCSLIIKQFKENIQTPYLCEIIDIIDLGETSQGELARGGVNNKRSNELTEKIRKATTLKKQIKEGTLTYIRNICHSLDSPFKLCQYYFNDSYWQKVLDGQGEQTDLIGRCTNLLKKPSLTKDDFKNCVQQLTKDPGHCHFENSQSHRALTPKQNCENISMALNYSRLYHSYLDCPEQIGNEGIVNAARLFFHLSTEYQQKYLIPTKDNLGCVNSMTAAFAGMNLDYDHEKAWALKACYEDKINQREACLPILMGNHPNSPYSEEKQIIQILFKTKGAEKNQTCEVVSKTEFNPSLLKYKYGCFLVYDPNMCYGVNCPKKIIFNEREITHITYKYGNEFDYYPTTISREKYAISGLIENQLKTNSTKVTSVTSLRFYLGQNSQYIIHGMGCAEDLLPSFFKKKTLHQCSLLPFIVDGLIEKTGRTGLVVRTALDEIHSPRIIDWNHVFNSVRTYQENHPMKYWGLNVIKK